jgi:polyisoprenoid-binding protein YceI
MKIQYLFMGLLALIFIAGCTAPPSEIERASVGESQQQDTSVLSNADEEFKAINPSLSLFEFEGYGPGKSHLGTFEIWDGFLIYQNNEIVGAYGSIDVSTVKTDSSGLDKHLLSSDFFDVELYPEIVIDSNTINNGIMTAELNFHGVIKDITFPVVLTENSISSEFVLSMEEFGISYTGVNDEVRIKFNFVAE